jgi:hypothetical protein
MTKPNCLRFLCQRFLIIALAFGLLSVEFAQHPVNAQAIGAREFTPKCDECVYTVSWNSDGGVDYYELFLVDPLHPDGRRRIYKGPSGGAYVTVRGIQTAMVRACYHPNSCSGLAEAPLIPDVQPDPGKEKDIRITEPIPLLHKSDKEVARPATTWPARDFNALMIDISATGQRVCYEESNQPIWSVGTRMKVRVAADVEFIATNLNIVEHQDGSWTWFGDIDGEHQGTLALTADRCGESVYMSIDSDAGQFVVQPVTEGLHVGYEVIAGERIQDCLALPSASATTLIDIVGTPGGVVPRSGQKTIVRSRAVSIDTSEMFDRFSPLTYLVGDDRNYDVARFLATATSIELFPGVPVPLDLHHGEFWSDSPDRWEWRGCVAGDPASKVRLSVDLLRKDVNLNIERDNRLVLLEPDGNGQYHVIEYEL